MDPARIAELLQPFLAPDDGRRTKDEGRLTADDLDKVSTYIDLLLRWNTRINLTAIRDPDQIVQRHFGESFFLARHLFPTKEVEAAPPFAPYAKGGNTIATSIAARSIAPSVDDPSPGGVKDVSPRRKPWVKAEIDLAPEGRKKARHTQSGTSAVPNTDAAADHADNAIHDDPSQLKARGSQLVVDRGPRNARVWRAGVVDLGSGAGFPALPLKIWAPEIHLTLIESNHKKAAFLREVVRALRLIGVDVIAARAEALVPEVAPSPRVAPLSGPDYPPALTADHAPGRAPHPNAAPFAALGWDSTASSPTRTTPESHPPHPEPHALRRRAPSQPALPPAQLSLPSSSLPAGLFPADIVTLRAVEKFDRILPLAARFLSPEGRLALLIGPTQLPALQTLSLKWTIINVPQSRDRMLAIGAKVT